MKRLRPLSSSASASTGTRRNSGPSIQIWLHRVAWIANLLMAIIHAQQDVLIDEGGTGAVDPQQQQQQQQQQPQPSTVSIMDEINNNENETTTTTSSSHGDHDCYMKQDGTILKKNVWTIGVLGIRGPEQAIDEFSATFGPYLTATAGQHFDPPITFQMKPLDFLTLFSDTEQELVDFLYVNPSAFSCIESEYGARSLVSQVSRRVVNGQTHDLKEFGGVIATLSNRTDIQTIHDLKDKVIAAASISGLGSGQMQFREMQNAGMSYINDPKQMIFTSNQDDLIYGVLEGKYDVAFVRTDQIERTKDKATNYTTTIDPALLKVVDPKPNLEIDGVPFPFQSSTPLYPEWNVAALSHVPDSVATELQTAMLAIRKHAMVGSAKQACELAHLLRDDSEADESEIIATANIDDNEDNDACLAYQTMEKRCDTTDEIAALALNATMTGKYSEWVPTLSYMELRSMQEATGFIERDPNRIGKWRCMRSAEIYDSISCPVGYLKKSEQEVANGCIEMGLDCQDGYQCICSPCYLPFECIDSINIGGRCVGYEVFLPSLLVPIAVLFVVACFTALGVKSRQMVNQAKQSAKNERDLNEFIAHEVRNPLSAALSASVFVSNAVQADVGEDTLDSLREDASIISSSLRFINDLLRSMLDVHRATRDQMILEMDSVDLLHDIFEPTASMIYVRDTNFRVEVDCPDGLVVRSDKLRLQQVVLNLARNSAKFVNEGFVRLRADVVDNNVRIYIEDSGPGIPAEKRQDLFNKYQKSLDSLAQGTGVGLSLVEKLVKLMDGSIYLDETYESGYNDLPGACMVVDLNQPPQHVDEDETMDRTYDLEFVKGPISNYSIPEDLDRQLPRTLSVLFVDDDRNIRKLAMRSLARIRPDYTVREAASGEACLQLCEKESFDLIFMDQYMTSVEQNLKGTETVRALRTRGVGSVICGLSANHMESVFVQAGADAFHCKPFPMDPSDLTKLLVSLFKRSRDFFALTETASSPDSSEGEYHESPGLNENDLSLPMACEMPPSKVNHRTTSDLSATAAESDSSYCELPKNLSVLFVDDDRTLRRLAMRALKNVAPECHVREANSGESALLLCETDNFDIIFMDYYMTSTNEFILNGQETVQALRKKGVTSLICGLSANQQEKCFLDAGADYFILKPFPCKPSELGAVLSDMMSKKRVGQRSKTV